MTASEEAIAPLPALDDDCPVFREPWEAQAFAMTVSLHEKGCFSWAEWAESLSHAIRSAQREGDPDTGQTYYRHWLAALENLLQNKGLISERALVGRREQWRRAAANTPHGEPIELTAAGGTHDH